MSNGKMKINPFEKPIIVLLVFFIFFSLISAIRFSWMDNINEILIDWQFKLRGERVVSQNFVFVFIGDEDVKTMNGWPITRDYYSYLIHILNQSGTKTIGIDVLFSKPDVRHPEYDRILEQFLTTAANVCLPYTFSTLSSTENDNDENHPSLMTGIDPTFPWTALSRSSAGVGFSNFGRVPIIRKVPLVVSWEDSIVGSFGLELARCYLNNKIKASFTASTIILPQPDTDPTKIHTEKKGMIRLNHFGDIANIQSVSAIDLMKTYESNPDSLDFKDKLVLIAVTASGIANLKTTPLSDSIPASLIQLTIAENCIEGNYIQELPMFVQWIIILIVIFLMYFVLQFQISFVRLVSMIFLTLIYLIIAMLIFTNLNLILPLFFPISAMLGTFLYFSVLKIQAKKSVDKSHLHLLQQQIRSKEKEIEETREQLKNMAAELHKESAISDQTRQLARERKETIQQLENEINDLNAYVVKKDKPTRIEFPEIIYSKNSNMKQVIELINKIRTDDIPVLINGETGTGKEMIARAIHQSSRRRHAIFIAINCGALSENLLESELFGHEKGSFTGAQSRRRGRFEIADGGTIFLDEITETNSAFQTRLLRVLQENTFERLGGEQTLSTNVRIIAASNKNINEEMKNNRFRADLFYRLNGFPINLPPLRERAEDIPLLAEHFLRKHKFEQISAISEQAMSILQAYTWPGNVRELENSLRRAAIIAQSESRKLIQENDLPPEIAKRDLILDRQTIHKPLEDQILEMLQSLNFSHAAISQTARALAFQSIAGLLRAFRQRLPGVRSRRL